MVERICSRCEHGNPLEHRYCGACGAPLVRDALVPRGAQPTPESTSLTIAGRSVSLQRVQQVGGAVALSLVALAAEAGLAYLARRVRQPDSSAPLAKFDPATPGVTVVSKRVIEFYEHGQRVSHVVDTHIWRKEG